MHLALAALSLTLFVAVIVIFLQSAVEPEHVAVPRNLKPRAVVSPTTRNRVPTDIQWRSHPPAQQHNGKCTVA